MRDFITARAVRPAATLAAAGLASLALTGAASASTQACPRPDAGSIVSPPPELFSSGGVLAVSLNYASSQDAQGRTLYCFITPEGQESPTLHVSPGDTLKISLTNTLSADGAEMTLPKMGMGANARPMVMKPNAKDCTQSGMYAQSVNMHFHGTNVTPTCHSDETIRTIVNPGETYAYTLKIPTDEPPGMYWYHPHVHGFSSLAVHGGASGAIIVDGIEAFEPRVANLPERTLIVRDQQVAGNPNPGGEIPAFDVSLNYAPIDWPALTPAVLQMTQGKREFWRILNASADLIADLQLTYDGVRQPLEIVALDGVPIGSQDGTRRGKTISQTDVLMPPAGRVELIMTAPPPGVRKAVLETLKIHGGPASDNNTHRVLATIQATADAQAKLPLMPAVAVAPWKQRFEGLDDAQVTAHRRLYFYELGSGNAKARRANPNDTGAFYITVVGQPLKQFDPNGPPAITTTQGAVEDWVIQNRSTEVHEFHMHQIHFELLEVNGAPVAANDRQFRDTVQVPYWTGTGPYPSVKLRMDFRGDIVGDFVYHCHILDHEDLGMMAKIRVLPAPK